MSETLYHGGVGGFWRGDILLPNHAEHRYVDGCPECAAQRAGTAADRGLDPTTPPDWIYATSDREYARYYASRAVNGWLYTVRLEGDVEASTEDPFSTWRGRRAIVMGVPERNVRLTHGQRRRLWRRWGGTDEEYAEMVKTVSSPARSPP